MGVIASHTLPENEAVVTTNLSINYLATATEGHLHAQASISHKGRQTIVTTRDVIDDRGKLLAIATESFFVIQRSR
ncbi:MAG TPA: PaaI family thioesterase [Paenisporosarcina sp.]|nr:PaaI family thioesterase [Paenisporosarcina sp.]